MAEEGIAARGGHQGNVVGTTLGPYLVERQIGRGGMSIVYQAKHIPLDRTVALKVLLQTLSGDQEFVDRFLAEARAAARLDYPHIVPVFDCGEVSGVNYIAMKLLEGRDLKRVLDARRHEPTPGLPLARAISIASQAAGALEYAHQHRVVHRDIKPANIYVDDNDRVTLVDFGIARALDHASSTLTGTVIGTPTYMSPEQAQGRPADSRSDIYSLGVVLYEMLTGAPPFIGEPQVVMHAHVYAEPPSLADSRADIPRGVDEVVQRALAKNPDDRYQNAGALALALTNAAGGRLSEQALEAHSSGDDTTVLLRSDTDPTGAVSGTHERMAGGITHGTMAQSASAEVAPEAAVRPARGGGSKALLFGLTAAAVVLAGILAWVFLAGPLSGADGRLSVETDPAGATVTVDGNRLGVTPLPAQKLSPGAHELILDKPSYLQVKRTERIRSRTLDSVRAALAPLPVTDLLVVKQAIVAKDVSEKDGVITIGAPVTGVKVEEGFGMVVTLAQKTVGARDVSFRYEIALFDPAGNRLTGSPSTNATVKSDDTAGQSFAFTFTFHPGSDGTVPVGAYELRFFIDNEVAASRPIALTR